MSLLSRILPCLTFVVGASGAFAQSFNVDIGNQPAGAGIPSNAYGAGAAQPGVWNGALPAPGVPVALNDVTGSATGVSMSRVGGGGPFHFNNAGTTGDDQNLMDDGQDLQGVGSVTTYTFANLAGGTYSVYTYAWAPDVATWQSTVACGAIDPPQTCGGAWPGTQTLGVTYTLHHISVAAGGSIAVSITTTVGLGTLGGFQLHLQASPFVNLCFGDGSGTQCPVCSGNGSPGNGCANSTNPAGSHLQASGNPSILADTVMLVGTGMPHNSRCLFFQGDGLVNGGAGAVFGAGLSCVTGSIVRLAVGRTDSSGSVQYPAAGQPPLSAAGHVTPGFRYVQVWVPDPNSTCMPPRGTTETVCIAWN